jgi:Domain of unknown function (DUF1844)
MNEENKIPTPQDMDTVRFFSLVTMFASSAYQGMGKIANPMTGKADRNLDSAQGFIDILIMLKKKTSGNLSENEEKILDSTLSDLQMNFVQEKAKPEPEEQEEEKTEGEEVGEEKITEEVPPAEAEEEETKEEGSASEPIITPPPSDDEEKKKE